MSRLASSASGRVQLKQTSTEGGKGRLELEEVMERCRAIEERSLNPFTLDVESILEIIRRYFPSWEKHEDLSLDAEAVNRLATVIRLQSEWVQRRTTSLYMDPLFVERRLKELSRDELALVFTSAWRPLIELETLTLESLRDAMEYWRALPTIDERWPQLLGDGSPAGALDRKEFLGSPLIDEQTFQSQLEQLYQELKAETRTGQLSYWHFVFVDTFEESVERSYLASFLVSYGWATLQVHPIEGEVNIQPLQKKPSARPSNTPSSIVLSISREEWERWREKK